MTEQRTSAVAAFLATLWGKVIALLTLVMMLLGIYVEFIQASKITIERNISAVELEKRRAELPAYTGKPIDLSAGARGPLLQPGPSITSREPQQSTEPSGSNGLPRWITEPVSVILFCIPFGGIAFAFYRYPRLRRSVIAWSAAVVVLLMAAAVLKAIDDTYYIGTNGERCIDGPRRSDNATVEQFDRAIAACTAFIASGKGDDGFWRATMFFNRAWYRYQKGEYDLALADINQAATLQPKHSYHAVRGQMYDSKGDLARAIDDYTEAIRQEPAFFPAIYSNRATARRKLGDITGAEQDEAAAARLEQRSSLRKFLDTVRYALSSS